MKGKSRLGGYDKRGRIFINPNVPETFHKIKMRQRLKKHEKVERKLRREQRLSYREAHKLALKEEHKGLTSHQTQVYEGKLGSIARWNK